MSEMCLSFSSTRSMLAVYLAASSHAPFIAPGSDLGNTMLDAVHSMTSV